MWKCYNFFYYINVNFSKKKKKMLWFFKRLNQSNSSKSWAAEQMSDLYMCIRSEEIFHSGAQILKMSTSLLWLGRFRFLIWSKARSKQGPASDKHPRVTERTYGHGCRQDASSHSLAAILSCRLVVSHANSASSHHSGRRKTSFTKTRLIELDLQRVQHAHWGLGYTRHFTKLFDPIIVYKQITREKIGHTQMKKKTEETEDLKKKKKSA